MFGRPGVLAPSSVQLERKAEQSARTAFLHRFFSGSISPPDCEGHLRTSIDWLDKANGAELAPSFAESRRQAAWDTAELAEGAELAPTDNKAQGAELAPRVAEDGAGAVHKKPPDELKLSHHPRPPEQFSGIEQRPHTPGTERIQAIGEKSKRGVELHATVTEEVDGVYFLV